MYTPDPFLVERRTALVGAARRLIAEAGPDGATLADPALAAELVSGFAEDVAGEIDDRLADGTETLEELVHALVEGALAAGEPWNEALIIIAVAIERITDFDDWAGIVGPWIDAVEGAIVRAQERGLVDASLDARATAMILRDTMQRSTQLGLRYGHDPYLETVTRIMVSALRPAAG